jgi:lysozyme family protein
MSDLAAQLLEKLIAKEGGYVAHADDRGGATKFGITETVARTAGWVGAMRDLPREFALAIYRRRYWVGPGFAAVAGISPLVAAELFDTGVNMGAGVATSFLQRSLNALNRQGRDWPDIAVDRSIGAATLTALRRLIAVRGLQGEATLLTALNALQGARYIELAEGRAANESFLYGWLHARVGAVA